CPLVIGRSALLVLVTSSLPFSSTSHAQPLPNCVVAAVASSFFRLSKLPKSFSMRWASAAGGVRPPLGFRLCQKNVWFHTCAELLNTPTLSALPADSRMIFSSGSPSSGVPAISLFRLSTYALWCLPWWKLSVLALMTGSSALSGKGSGGRVMELLTVFSRGWLVAAGQQTRAGAGMITPRRREGSNRRRDAPMRDQKRQAKCSWITGQSLKSSASSSACARSRSSSARKSGSLASRPSDAASENFGEPCSSTPASKPMVKPLPSLPPQPSVSAGAKSLNFTPPLSVPTSAGVKVASPISTLAVGTATRSILLPLLRAPADRRKLPPNGYQSAIMPTELSFNVPS